MPLGKRCSMARRRVRAFVRPSGRPQQGCVSRLIALRSTIAKTDVQPEIARDHHGSLNPVTRRSRPFGF